MASSKVEEFTDLKYYAGAYCKCCQELDKMKFEPQYDDDDYLEPDDDFDGDDTLKLHVINYRRNLALNGSFVFTCPPWYGDLGICPHAREHYAIEPGCDKTIDNCAIFAVTRYNKALGAYMELLAVENAAVEGRIRRRFYMILRCRELETSDDDDDDDDDGGSPDDDGKRKRSSGGAAGKEEKIFRVVVACCWWRKSDMEVLVFKDYSSWKNLLQPDPHFDALTVPKERRSLPPNLTPGS